MAARTGTGGAGEHLRVEADPRQGPPGGGTGRGLRWRALAAAALSCLVPGAGQLYLRRWRRGTVLLAVSVLCVAGAAIAGQRRAGVARLLLRPSWLIALLAVDLVLLAFRAWSVIDAYRLGAGRPAPAARRAAPLVAAGLGLVLAATVLPHAVVGYYDVQAYDLLTSVFHRSRHLAASPMSPGVGPAPNAVPGRFTVLLIGGDAGPGRFGLRTDTMIVASIEPATGRIVLFGLPRNLVQAPLPEGPGRAFECRCFPHPLNELYAYAREHPQLFPGGDDPGVTAVQGAAERLLGIRIDYHALVNLRGFVDMVDAVGGVWIETTEPIHIEIDRLGTSQGGQAFDLRPGRHHLNGLTALAYARSRKTTSDYDRMRRQRCLIGALARQVDAGQLLRSFPSLVRVAKRDVSTDIPLDLVPSLIGTTGQHRPHVEALGFTPPDFASRWSGGYPVPDVRRIQRSVQATLRGTTITVAPADSRPGTTATTRATAATERGTTGSGTKAPAQSGTAGSSADPCRILG